MESRAYGLDMPPTMDYKKATKLLAQGATVRQVALQMGVTTQAIYYAIARGHVQRPEPQPAAENS